MFGDPLQDALKDRAIRDKVREVHITHCDPKLLTSIISSLTPDGEGVREKRIESITLRLEADTVIVTGLLDFFARETLPKLQYLDISGFFQIPSWGHLPSLTTRLTTQALAQTRTTGTRSNHILADFNPYLEPQSSRTRTVECGTPRRHRWVCVSSTPASLESDLFGRRIPSSLGCYANWSSRPRWTP